MIMEGTEEVEEEKGSVSRELDDEDLINGMLQVIESVRSFGDYRRTQKKACQSLIRRMKLVVPFLEEIRDHDMPIPDWAYEKLCNLLAAFNMAKKLLRCCHDGSKIYLALESESVMARFRCVNEKLSQVFEGMLYDELGISDEVKEQVELMSSQVKRARKRTDTQDMELAMDLMIVSEKNSTNADSASLERLAQRLELHTLPDLSAETMAIKKLIKERCGQISESTEQIIDLLSKFKKLAGIEDNDGLKDVNLPKYFDKCPSLVIPSDFLCPITLEIMTDPVIVASGQSFERLSIRKWFEAGNKTCPKTRQTLAHLSVAPNYALRNLILQWCEMNKIELSKKEECADSDQVADQKEGIESLVLDLSSIHLNVQRKSVKKIRMLSKENPENRILIAKSGGIPSLVSLLTYPDSKIQENTVTALLNLSIDEVNKVMITKEGAIPAIIDILKNGQVQARENSAAALFSLSMINDNKALIGSLNGIPLLVDLLRNGTIRGKKDAAAALFNLCLYQENKGRAIRAGVMQALLQILSDKNIGMVDETLSFFLLLISHPEACIAITQTSLIETLVDLLKEGTPKNKEFALCLILELGLHDSSFILAALKSGAHEYVSEATNCGTNRAQRKAKSLLQLINKCEYVP